MKNWNLQVMAACETYREWFYLDVLPSVCIYNEPERYDTESGDPIGAKRGIQFSWLIFSITFEFTRKTDGPQ